MIVVVVQEVHGQPKRYNATLLALIARSVQYTMF